MRPLRLKRIDPASGRIFLNHKLDFVFDKRIDPESVNEDTVRILDDAGHQIPGRLQVSSYTVSFIPVAPTSVDLRNGSFQPGRSYRSQLPCFPLANAIRGSSGEILLEAKEQRWTAVSAPPPAGFPSEFLVSSGDGNPFHVLPIPSIGQKGAWIRLQFNRPLYPRTVSPRALRLLMLSPSSAEPLELPLRKVEVQAGNSQGGYGSALLLEPLRPLPSGRYLIKFRPGSEGLLDYATNPLCVLQLMNGEPSFVEGGHLEFYVDARASPSPFRLSFAAHGPSGSLAADPKAMGLPGDLEGVLAWSSDGLRLPTVEYEGFDSLGNFEAKDRLVVLKPGLPLPGHTDRLLGQRWDFDRFIVPKGKRVIIVLKGKLQIRVLGRFEILGELLVRDMESSDSALVPTGAVQLGDPRPSWSGSTIKTQLAVEVLGLCRLFGRIAREHREPGKTRPIPGYIWARGPFLGAWQTSALQAWQRPARLDAPPGPGKSIDLPGRWAYLSGWLDLAPAQSLSGKYRLSGSFDAAAVELLVQGRFAAKNEDSAWVSPELLSEFQSFMKLRVALFVDAGRAREGDMLEFLEIW